MQRILNEKVKNRENFRPFAPAVTAEGAGEYFEISRSSAEITKFMLSVAKVKNLFLTEFYQLLLYTCPTNIHISVG